MGSDQDAARRREAAARAPVTANATPHAMFGASGTTTRKRRRVVASPRAASGRAGVLVVSTRPAVCERVRAATQALGLSPPSVVARAGHLPRIEGGEWLLCLDLAVCCCEPGLVAALRAWSARGPRRLLVIFAPLVDRERELRATALLTRAIRRARVRVMTTTDFFDDLAWRRLRAADERVWLLARVRTRLLAAARASGRSIPALPLVLAQLREVWLGRMRIEERDAHDAGVHARAESHRKLRWRMLRRAGQMPESWLRCVLRVLWYLTLRDAGWSTRRIARSLGYRSERDLRRTVHRRLGIRFRELRRLPGAAGFAWAGELLTSRHQACAGPTLRELAGALRRASGGIAGSRVTPHSAAR